MLHEFYIPKFANFSSATLLHPLAACSFSPLGQTSTISLRWFTIVCIASWCSFALASSNSGIFSISPNQDIEVELKRTNLIRQVKSTLKMSTCLEKRSTSIEKTSQSETPRL